LGNVKVLFIVIPFLAAPPAYKVLFQESLILRKIYNVKMVANPGPPLRRGQRVFRLDYLLEIFFHFADTI
jgi:hypothetical protein